MILYLFYHEKLDAEEIQNFLQVNDTYDYDEHVL